MLWRWFGYGRSEPGFAAVTVQLRSAGAGTWGELPFHSIAFLSKISVPSHRAAENGSLLCAEAKALARSCRPCQREFEEPCPPPDLLPAQTVTGSWIPSLHDTRSDARGAA